MRIILEIGKEELKVISTIAEVVVFLGIAKMITKVKNRNKSQD